jgi:archaeosortase A (PGF-CTERM-specific)
MLDLVLDGLAWLHRFSDPLAWLVLATFLLGALLERSDTERARPVSVGGWLLFGLFWLTLVHHFTVTQKSFIEGIGSIVAVPVSVYVGYLLWSGRDSLFVLSRAIAIMGVLFFPFETIPLLRQVLVETVTTQVEFLLSLVGVEPAVIDGTNPVINLGEATTYPYRNTFLFERSGTDITYTILLACTGIGSMSIFAGLILATNAPMNRKIRALAVSIPVIYALNLVRNVFIAVTFGEQLLHVFPGLISTLFGLDPAQQAKVSYYIGDRIIAQSLSVVALVAITYLVVRELPEILTIVEDLLYVATGSEYDLTGALDVQPTRADGGSEPYSRD